MIAGSHATADQELASVHELPASSAGMQSKRTAPVRMLVVANVAAMFRDFLNPFAAHFRNKGWRVDAIARDIEDSADCKGVFDNTWDIKWSRNPFGIENFVEAPRAFLRRVEDAGYDLIHVHTPVPAFISRWMTGRIPLRRRPKIIYTAHGFHFHSYGSPWKNRIFVGLERLAGRWTDCLVVINRTDEEAARLHRLVPAEKIVLMPGIGINRCDYESDTVSDDVVRRFRNELGLSGGERIITMLAEFAPGKRHKDAVHAFASMANTNVHLVLAGEGPLQDEISALAARLGVGNRVHIVGFRRDVPAILKSSTMKILPSEREGLPKSIMEALNMGLPVVGTDVRGIRDLLADSAGVLVPLGDVAELAKAMDWVLEHPAEASVLGNRGRSRMSIYERDNIIRLHEDLYTRLLNYACKESPRRLSRNSRQG
jgi:glycosyltransferase involved in cell wall biosynthesis